jgi:hypothetical protein
VVGHGAVRTSDGHKRAFLKTLGFTAHDARVYPAHFSRPTFDAARGRVANVAALLALLGVG